MATYAFVTSAPAEVVGAAVRAGRVGGFVAADPLGTIVLFDPPRTSSATSKRLAKPAADLAGRTGAPGWLLLADHEMAEAMMISPVAGRYSLTWVDGWEPPEDPAAYLADRQDWDHYCTEVATRFGARERGVALAMVRNDPVPGESPAALSDLLRRVCAVFGLPDVAVGHSLLDGAEPGLYDARRVDAAPGGAWRRLLGRF